MNEGDFDKFINEFELQIDDCARHLSYLVQDIYLNTSRPNVFDSQRFAQMNDVADRKMDRLR